MAEWILWTSLALLAYVYAGFSLVVVLVASTRNRGVRREAILPSVSLIIAAYNEENCIARRLEDALALDYPHDRLEILVASDGSDDTTDSIVERYASRGVKLLRLPRQGKINALNAAVAHAGGEILVFSDADTMYAPDALRKLTRNFADAEVGGVAGATCHRLSSASDSSSKGEELYWSFDGWLKQMESRTGSIVSAAGSIYAIRRDLYQPPADSGVTDDFAISTAVVEQGYRLVYENEARAYTEAVPKAEGQFWRKVRVMSRGVRGVILRKRLLNPFRYGFYSIVLLSHKILRRLAPVFLLMLLLANLPLAARNSVYATALALQTLFYGLAFTGFALRRYGAGKAKVFYIPFFYCLANTAALVALINLVRGRRIERWQHGRESKTYPRIERLGGRPSTGFGD